jgi:CubicO group peptidase (beta-lactamase class C family)
MPVMRLLLLVALALLTLSCASSGSKVVEEAASAPWQQWATAEDAGFDGQALEQARLRADELKSAAVMVVYRGRVLAAWGDVERKLELHSVRKSLYAAMYGVAAGKGLINLYATLEELGVDDRQGLTDEERKAKLDDLLYARSGVYHPAAYAPADQSRSRPLRGSHPPGTHWFYNNWDFNVAGALLAHAANEPFGNAFQRWIAAPIGMEDYAPQDVFAVLEPRTSEWPAYTLRMSTRDLARFGRLWLQRGQWDGRNVIPASWVDRASTPRSQLGAPGDGYAMMWWTHAAGSLPAERYPVGTRYAMLRASGTGGQVVVIIPELDLVFVHRGDTDHGRQVGGRDVWGLLEQILAARRGEPRAEATPIPLQPVALSSQLPPFEFPTPIQADAATLAPVAGVYRFGRDVDVVVYIHEDRLFATVPGLGEAELFPTSPTEFFVRVDPTGFVRFEGDKVTARIDGKEMRGERMR